MSPNGTNVGRKLKICVVQPSVEQEGCEFKDLDCYTDPGVYDPEKKYEWKNVVLHKATVGKQMVDLAKEGHDVYLNLCDGAFDESRAGLEVVQAFERLNLAYTGSDATFYEPTKIEMKQAVHYVDVKYPKWIHAQTLADAEPALAHLRFPLIVKHPSGYGSVSMTKDSKCTTAEQLKQQVEKFIAEYGGALIEEFIEGREFTVLVVDNPEDLDNPVAYLPVECIFKNGEDFKHFDLKWKDYEDIQWVACEDPDLDKGLRHAAVQAYKANRGVSYGRCDFRVSKDGTIYFLEINPNCGVLYPPGLHGSADFIISIDPTIDHLKFIDTIVQSALARHRQKKGKVVKRYNPAACGYGLYTTCDVAPGELVVKYEETEHVLVTKQYVERTWPAGSVKREWFGSYAYPISESVWVTWSEDPSKWLPINHSCDPNCVVDGLDMVARRALKEGEQITLDYATFCGEMTPFDCSCGSSCCRGRITGEDHKAAWLEEKYGRHLSPYVAAKRAAALAAAAGAHGQADGADTNGRVAKRGKTGG